MVRVSTADTTSFAALETLAVTGADNIAGGCRITDRGHCCRDVGCNVNVSLICGSQCVKSGLNKAPNVVQQSHITWLQVAWRGIRWLG